MKNTSLIILIILEIICSKALQQSVKQPTVNFFIASIWCILGFIIFKQLITKFTK